MSCRMLQPFPGASGRFQDAAHPNGCEHLHRMKAGRLGQVTRAWMRPTFMPPCSSVAGLMDASTALYAWYAAAAVKTLSATGLQARLCEVWRQCCGLKSVKPLAANLGLHSHR